MLGSAAELGSGKERAVCRVLVLWCHTFVLVAVSAAAVVVRVDGGAVVVPCGDNAIVMPDWVAPQ